MSWYLATPGNATINALGASSCDVLRAEIVKIDTELEAIATNGTVYINTYKQMAGTRYVVLQGEIAALKAAVAANDNDLFFARLNAGLLVGLGVVSLVAGPGFALGGLVIYEMLGPTGIMGWQLYRSTPAQGQSIIVSYFGGQVLYLATLNAEKTTSPAGKFVGKLANVLTIGISAYELHTSTEKQANLSSTMSLVTAEMDDIEAQMAKLTNNPIWLLFRTNHLEGARSALNQFIADNQASNCVVLDLNTGPIIKGKP
ncbi:MAG: hypothetical protein H0T56_15080 [Pseudaminobacter sp.]|nr:hypothetical protein [Pseudaminobacter sp.]